MEFNWPERAELKAPALEIGWQRNIELMPRLVGWFPATLCLIAGTVFLVAGFLIPAEVRTSIWIWLPGLIASLGGIIWIKTKAGFVLLGFGAGLLTTAAYFFAVADRNLWFWVILSLAAIYGLLGLVRLANALQKLNDLAVEASRLGCQIILFRPFDPRYARWASNTVLPILDGYGEITHVSDKNFESAKSFSAWRLSYDNLSVEEPEEDDAKSIPGSERENSDSAAVGIEGEVFLDSDWMVRVEDLIETIDIVVIDVSGFTKNVNWELEKSLARLPPDRVILVAHVDSIPELQAQWDTIAETYRSAGITRQEEMLVIPYAPWQSPQFALYVHERMKQILSGSNAQ